MPPHIREALSMKPETAEKVKYGVWGLIIGAVIAMTIGFQWGGWSTRGTSQQMTDAALLTTRAAICVAQFIKDPNHKSRLKELKASISWQRTEFVEKGGWDKMPGVEKASYTVSRACADGRDVLIEKKANVTAVSGIGENGRLVPDWDSNPAYRRKRAINRVWVETWVTPPINGSITAASGGGNVRCPIR